jgi:uncharacterized protein YjbI with pentapeptide repeats
MGEDLTRADFSREVLRGRHFVEARLLGADFSEAELSGVVFERCELSGAELFGCDLSGAGLSRYRWPFHGRPGLLATLDTLRRMQDDG